MLKCEKLELWSATDRKREEVDVALGCFEQLWNDSSNSYSKRSTIKTRRERNDILNFG